MRLQRGRASLRAMKWSRRGSIHTTVRQTAETRMRTTRLNSTKRIGRLHTWETLNITPRMQIMQTMHGGISRTQRADRIRIANRIRRLPLSITVAAGSLTERSCNQGTEAFEDCRPCRRAIRYASGSGGQPGNSRKEVFPMYCKSAMPILLV